MGWKQMNSQPQVGAFPLMHGAHEYVLLFLKGIYITDAKTKGSMQGLK